tara:strand:- start:7480 stop:7713 length:234 start_codon:yes stop_codon:yes gene_type:complete
MFSQENHSKQKVDFPSVINGTVKKLDRQFCHKTACDKPSKNAINQRKHRFTKMNAKTVCFLLRNLIDSSIHLFFRES